MDVEDVYKPILMMKWANKVITNKTSKVRRTRLIRKVHESKTLILQKLKTRKNHKSIINNNISVGYYKNPE
jgi:hypothetical protein